MTDIVISCARETEGEAQRVAEALRGLGYEVWRDDQIPAHRAFGEMIEERLAATKVVLVLWSATAAKSDWVRSEASRARAMGKLVQLTLDKSPLPIPFDQIQCANLVGWNGEADVPGWLKVVASIADLIASPSAEAVVPATPALTLPTKPSIAVLPFANLSGDPEQEYFADGMVVEIVEALSRVRSIFVIASGSGLSFAKAEMLAALDLFNRAFVLDPDYGVAISMVVICHAHIIANGWSDDPADHFSEIKTLSGRALRSAGDDPDVLLNVATAMHMTGGDPEAAAALIDRALALNPGSSATFMAAGFQRLASGDLALAFERLETALRLDPLSRYRALALGGQGATRFAQERFPDAVQLLKQSIQLRPEWVYCYPFLVASYGHLGDTGAARKAMELYRTISPMEIRAGAALWPNPETRELLLDGIALAEGTAAP